MKHCSTLVTPKLVLVHESWPLFISPPDIHVQHKAHFSVHSVRAWWISWRMGPWIFNNSANIKANNVYSFLCNLMNELVPVLPTGGSSPAQMLALCAKAVFHAVAPIRERTEERLMSTLHSRSIFPFWLFAKGEGNIMTFLTTPDYLDSFLPWEQRSLKNKTSAELLLLRGSQVAV